MRWIKRAFEIPIHLLAVQWFWLGAARLAFIPLCMLATFSLGGAGMLLGTLVGALLGAPSHHLHLLSWPVALLLLCVPICWGICQRQGASSGLARMLLHLFAAAWMLWGMQLAHSQLSFVSPALSPLLSRHLVMSLSMVAGEDLRLFIGTCLMGWFGRVIGRAHLAH